ncbi:hypothetical protein QYE76_069004 [Lolium multiflorum]|uniref:CCHC-type domain-containing protein n=1 Tax=Lolium multiflorum TaxID=4521 RepID=A0AAD8WEH2_LOLMU|nr:hypothetical protein QYE76_069004 [Lolium multiflorum]
MGSSSAARVRAPRGRERIRFGCSSMVTSGGVHTGGDDLDGPAAAHLRLFRPPPIWRLPRPAPTAPSSLLVCLPSTTHCDHHGRRNPAKRSLGYLRWLAEGRVSRRMGRMGSPRRPAEGQSEPSDGSEGLLEQEGRGGASTRSTRARAEEDDSFPTAAVGGGRALPGKNRPRSFFSCVTAAPCAHFRRFLIYIKRKSSHEMWIKLKEMFGGSTSHLVGGDSEELSSPSHHEELQVASTSGRDEFSSSSTSPTCSKTREETEHSMDQDMFSNEDSRISSSSSSGMHMCLMANGSKVSPTLTPNTSSNDESDDDDNDEEYNILVHNMAMVYASLHEEIKELEAQVLSLKKDLEKRHEGKSTLDKMLSVQQSPNDKSGLGFNSNNKNKSKSKNNKKKGQDKVNDSAKLVCFKCKVEGHHVRSCPLKKKKHLSEKQQGKRPQGQGQAHARPQVEDRPLPKKNQDIVPQEKKSIKKRKGNTCYLCRVKGHFASSCLSGTLSNPIIVDNDYSLGKDKDGNVFAKFVGTQSGLKKRTIWVAKPIVTNILGPNLVGDQQAQT